MLPRSRATLSIIAQQASSADPLINNFLAQYMTVVIYSEIEEIISNVIKQRIEKYSAAHIAEFISKNMDGIIRRTKKSDIASLVKLFGDDFDRAFQGYISDQIVTSYGNIITARQLVGHRAGSNIDLDEVSNGVHAAEKILFALNCCFDAVEAASLQASG